MIRGRNVQTFFDNQRKWQVVRESRDSSYCVYDKDIATGLGIGSFLVLLASQLFIMVASRCLCCGRALSPSGSRTKFVKNCRSSWVKHFDREYCRNKRVQRLLDDKDERKGPMSLPQPYTFKPTPSN
ncbi:unnamed protein product [Arabis nemorensis]|uniref:Uncharacterized protein n=1 Tax=Arabis nemorensis TaxID=586526 RepID=A0A565CRY7_9BRAS|nr:unnamed protein product [Arabis nemorensis]